MPEIEKTFRAKIRLDYLQIGRQLSDKLRVNSFASTTLYFFLPRNSSKKDKKPLNEDIFRRIAGNRENIGVCGEEALSVKLNAA